MKLTLSKLVFCLFAGEPRIEDFTDSEYVESSGTILAGPGNKSLSLAAEDSMATIAACRNGCQWWELDCVCFSAQPHGNKQDTPLYNASISCGKPLGLSVWLSTDPSISASGLGLKVSCCLWQLISVDREQVWSHAREITCLTEGFTITAALTTWNCDRWKCNVRNSEHQKEKHYCHSKKLKIGFHTEPVTPDFASWMASFMKLKIDSESSSLNPVIPSMLL